MIVLSVVKNEKQAANESTVEVLDGLLADARNGEVETVFVIAIRPDRSYRSIASNSLDNLRTLGAIEVIKADLLNEMRD